MNDFQSILLFFAMFAIAGLIATLIIDGTQSSEQWILMTDRPPPKGERVLVVMVDRPHRGEYTVLIGWYNDLYRFRSGGEVNGKIIAWRPLPDVPDSLFWNL